MTELEKLGVFQLYPPKTKFENKYDWKYVPIHTLFDVKHQNLYDKARIVVRGHVVNYKGYTVYSSTTKNVSTILIILIAVKNGLGVMSVYIGNELCKATCDI